MARSLVKIAHRRPREVCADFEPSESALLQLASDPSPEELLRSLIEQDLYSDAAQYLAYALPKREAVWWGVVVTREQDDSSEGAAASKAVLAAAEAWVRKPTDENRRAAMAAADADRGSPASMVGIAAFMAAGSIAPAGLEEVSAPANLTGTMVASAVILTAVTPDPLAAADKYKRFLARGIEIAQGPPQG